MKIAKKLIIAGAVAVFGFAVSAVVIGAASLADRSVIEQDELFWEEYEAGQERMEEYRENRLNKFINDYNIFLIAKVVGFESGYCCDKCQYYVASACMNRKDYWYGGDAVSMIEDGNDEYYYMNPVYVDAAECNGWCIWDHYDDAMAIVKKALKNAANIWYWDCDDTQGEWAELVWVCEEDGLYFYK